MRQQNQKIFKSPNPEALILQMYWYKDPLKPPNNQAAPYPVGNQDAKCDHIHQGGTIAKQQETPLGEALPVNQKFLYTCYNATYVINNM